VESPAKTYSNCIFAFGVTSKVIAPAVPVAPVATTFHRGVTPVLASRATVFWAGLSLGS
jgi:hypothetical protein